MRFVHKREHLWHVLQEQHWKQDLPDLNLQQEFQVHLAARA